MTAEDFKTLYRTVLRQLDGVRPQAFCADFRAPLWALREHDLNQHLDGADPKVLVPAALIVAPAAFELFRGHAWSVAQAGILRKVFICPKRAHAWLAAWMERQHPRTVP